MDKEKLIQHINKYITLGEDEIHILDKYFKTISLKRKNYLLKQGELCDKLYFVERGCLRMFYINNKLSEQITQFAIEGWWISDYTSFLNNTPSEYYIQAIEKSEILTIDRTLLDDLLKEISHLEKYFRLNMQKGLAAAQHRTKLEHEMSKEEFYFHFNTSFPEFVQRVPQYMIASYLGLTPEYVSELRKKKQ